MSQTQPFLSVDHRVVGVEVHVGDESLHDVRWEVSYGERDAEESVRYALGWLHGAGEGIQVTVSVGAVVVDTGIPYADDDFSRLFGESDACEALYESARMAGSVAISLTRENLELPAIMPPAQVEPFPDDDDELVPD